MNRKKVRQKTYTVESSDQKRILKPNDREVVAIARFHRGAGVIPEKQKDAKRRRMQGRREEKRARSGEEE